MMLNPEKVAFGRHEKFPLRFSWLPKGVQALEKDPKVFESDDSTVRLGVGRNMVNSIRYWLRASQMIDSGSYKVLDLGRILLSSDGGYDPYLEDEASIWLLHWLLASNAELATSQFWFFNKFHKSEFSSDELVTALGDYINDVLPETKRPAKNTIKSDASVLPRMYTQSKITQRMPLEEVLDSPFSILKLVEHKSNERIFVSRFLERPNLPVEILGYAVLSVMKFRGQGILPIEDLMYSKDNFAVPGSVFRISENDFIRKLELLVQLIPTSIEIRESSGIHQLFLLDDYDPVNLIHLYYRSAHREVAA